MLVDAVVLAGRENTGRLREVSSERYEANIEIAGKPMVTFILDVLDAMPEIGRVYLVGPSDGLGRYAGGKVEVVEPGADLFDNVRIGLEAAKTEYVVICASDVPLVTRDIMKRFLDACEVSGADFCYPVSSQEDCDRLFPGVKRTYVALREGTFTGGNIFFVHKPAIGRAWPMVEKMIGYRKSPLKMASVLGPGLLLKFALKMASVAELEERVAELLDLKPKAILGADPEIGVDVDKPSDLELCRRILAK
jgi:molybdopterin-guanine dinucleotide biosynthesis protein A